MNKYQLKNYYLTNRNEFSCEEAQEKLLKGLKKFITPIDDKNIKVIGIDVGTCIGKHIQHIRDICPERNKILCFEPNPLNNIVLESNLSFNEDLKLFKHCLSNETSISQFYDWKDSNHNWVGNGLAGLRSGGRKICDVDVKKLDDVLDSEFNHENIVIKFIKIDTEGNDSNVLKGFEKYLSKTKYIIFECSDCLDDIRGPGIKNPMKDVIDFLSKNGFDTYRIGSKKLFKVNAEYWDQVYDDVKFCSDCFALRKDDTLINKLIDENFDYKY